MAGVDSDATIQRTTLPHPALSRWERETPPPSAVPSRDGARLGSFELLGADESVSLSQRERARERENRAN